MNQPVNVLEHPTTADSGRPPGYRGTGAMLGTLLGAKALGASIYDLEPGESVCPYHYEHGREEWLVVLAGRPTLRTPDGERRVEPWDAICFPEGPGGAHKVTNRSDAPARVLLLSTKGQPVVWVYPDSGKLGVSSAEGFFRLADAVGYWDGE